MKPTDYPIFLVYSNEDNAWLARVDMLGGCVADGATPEEALANVKEQITLWIQTSTDLKRSIPRPFDAQELEDFQINLAAQHGQKIQQLIQDGITQVLSQIAKTTGESRFGHRSGSLMLPTARIDSISQLA